MYFIQVHIERSRNVWHNNTFIHSSHICSKICVSSATLKGARLEDFEKKENTSTLFLCKKNIIIEYIFILELGCLCTLNLQFFTVGNVSNNKCQVNQTWRLCCLVWKIKFLKSLVFRSSSFLTLRSGWVLSASTIALNLLKSCVSISHWCCILPSFSGTAYWSMPFSLSKNTVFINLWFFDLSTWPAHSISFYVPDYVFTAI